MKRTYLFFFFSVVILMNESFSQDIPPQLTHHMTPEEELRRDEIGRDFTPSEPPLAPVRAVAEFEPMEGVLIRYPFGIPMDLIVEMAEDDMVKTIVSGNSQKNQVLNQYIAAGVDTSNCEWLIAPTNSYWTRDYGPWFVVDSAREMGICDFPYNRPRADDDEIPVELATQMGIPWYGMSLIHTGGNWMCDGMGVAASTDLVWTENPTLAHHEIDSLVQLFLGVDQYHVLPDPLGEYIEHIDCWAKFLDVDKVLIGQVPESDPRYDDFEYVADYFSQQSSSYGTPYEISRIFTPGDYPYTPYTNSLILNRKVFVPQTGSEWDDEAIIVYQGAMPGYEIIGVPYGGWINTDALHCRVIGIADTGMLYVEHLPLLGSQAFCLSYPLSADIIPYSGHGLVADSLFCCFSVDGGGYDTLVLSDNAGSTYSLELPFLPPGSQVSYYLHAADSSGRIRRHPLIGLPDPHVFTVDFAADATVSPDTLVFSTQAEMLSGQEFDIYNFTLGNLDITGMEVSSTAVFSWNVDPWNYTLPIAMAYSDTLSFNIEISLPVDNQQGNFLYDTLDINTTFGVKQLIIKAAATGRWKGVVSNDWNDPANWVDLTVPSGTTDIFIPAGAENQPVFDGDLTIGSDCGNMIIEGPAQLTVNGVITISPGMELTIKDGAVVLQMEN